MRAIRFIGAGFAVIGIVLAAYAGWYTYNRAVIVHDVRTCAELLATPMLMRAPDGTMVPVQRLEPCAALVVPPRLSDLLSGEMVFDSVPDGLRVNPYTFSEMLLGEYTFGPDIVEPCDQRATSTDCSQFLR